MDTINPCCCCLFRPANRNIKTPYAELGVTEIYSNMIEECFAVEMTRGDDADGICEVCVGRLRDARDFKLQVQRSQAELRARLDITNSFKAIDADSALVSIIIDDEESKEITLYDPSFKPELEAVSGNEQCIGDEISIEVDIDSHSLAENVSDNMFGLPTDMFDDTPLECLMLEEPPIKFEISDAATNDDHNFMVTLYEPEREIETPHPARNELFDTKRQLSMTCSVRLERLRDDRAPHVCPTCHSTYEHAAILAAHVHVHETKQIKNNCNYCGKDFASRTGLELHLKKCIFLYKPKRRKSHDSGGSEDTSRNTDTSDERFLCDGCDVKFPELWQLTLHKQCEHTNNTQFNCHLCNKAFRVFKDLVIHRVKHINPVKVTVEERDKRYRSVLGKRKEKKGKSYKCDICALQFESMYELYLHIRMHT